MRRLLQALAGLACLCVLPALPARADDLPNLPARKCVLDQTGRIDGASLSHLESVCESVDTAGVGQLNIAIVSSLGDRDRETYATDLFAKWKPGHKGRDDGLLILVRPGTGGHGDIKIETGYGFEGAFPDGKVGRMLDEVIPLFKQDQWGAGLVKLADQIAADMGKENGEGAIERRAAAGRQRAAAKAASFSIGVGIGAFFLAFYILLLVFRIRHHLPGKIALGGGTAGTLLTGLWALSAGGEDRAPLMIFWGFAAVFGVVAFYMVARHKCPKCGKWLDIESTTLVEATYYSEGQEEVREHCKSCGYRHRYTRTISRKTPPSSGSSSGGGGGGGGGSSGYSGGGGGSSCGGGAGRSF
ncbi:MAG: TPM domain-containing protein [Deltaproteobacteria bacterium]|nr:TPM domain-containing protein [Deltaproteobacteria bacterium]